MRSVPPLPPAALAAVAVFLISGCGSETPAVRRIPVVGDHARVLPVGDAVPGLWRVGAPRTWSAAKAGEYLDPEQVRWYTAYGMTAVTTAEYEYTPPGGGPPRPITIEAIIMRRPLGAAGAFHWVRTEKLKGAGDPILGLAGAEGVADRRRGAGNYYLYKRDVFYKILDRGPRPAPDLAGVAGAAAASVKEFARPMRAFEWMNDPGVDLSTAAVTPGNPLQCPDLPQAAWARAPGAGERALVFVIESDSRQAAESVEKAYRQFLRINGKDMGGTTTDKGRRDVWWAVDRGRQPVIATRKGNAILIVAHADSNRAGGELLDRLAARIDP